jgi:hypothetical protein
MAIGARLTAEPLNPITCVVIKMIYYQCLARSPVGKPGVQEKALFKQQGAVPLLSKDVPMRNPLLISLLAAAMICVCNSKDPDDGCAYDGYQLLSYSANALINKYELFDANNNGQYYFTYAYNANDYIVSATVRNYSGTIIGYATFVNDSSGNAEKEIYMDQDSALLFYYLDTYNADGDILTLSEYSADSALESVQKYLYDESGKQSIIETYNNANTLVYKYVNQRSSDGLLVSANKLDANGDKIGYKIYTYSSSSPFTLKISFYDCTGGGLSKSAFWWNDLREKREWHSTIPLHRPAGL